MNKQDVTQKLQQLLTRVQSLLGIVENHRTLSPQEIKEAQIQLKQLKKDLEIEYKRTRVSKNLSDAEETMYQPAIRGAWANSLISAVRWNSVPDHKWLDKINNVELEISWYLAHST